MCVCVYVCMYAHDLFLQLVLHEQGFLMYLMFICIHIHIYVYIYMYIYMYIYFV
jgi:hypothetical protein